MKAIVGPWHGGHRAKRDRRRRRAARGREGGLPLIRFPLERTADACDAVQNSAVGKVLIDLS